MRNYIYALFLLPIVIVHCVQQSSTKENVEDTNYTQINRQGKINTFVDGYEMHKVNIWESNKNKDKILTTCKKDEEVLVLLSDGYYFKIRTQKGVEGWLMEEFVVLNE